MYNHSGSSKHKESDVAIGERRQALIEQIKRLKGEGKTRAVIRHELGLSNNNMSSICSAGGISFGPPIAVRRKGAVQSPHALSKNAIGVSSPATPSAAPSVATQTPQPKASLPADEPAKKKSTRLSTQEKIAKRLNTADEFDLGGAHNPFPSPREISRNPNDPSFSELAALRTMYVSAAEAPQ